MKTNDFNIEDFMLACEIDFEYFIRFFFREIHGANFEVQPFHRKLIQALSDRVIKKNSKNLIVNIPPRHGKTIIMSVFFPAWCFIRNPRCRFLVVNRSKELLIKNSLECKQIMQQPFIRNPLMWNIHLPREHNAKQMQDDKYLQSPNSLINTQTYWNIESVCNGVSKVGNYMGRTIFSNLKGYEAGIKNPLPTDAGEFDGAVLFDDINADDDIASQVSRDRVGNAFFGSLMNRPNRKDVPVIGAQQRVHIDDITGRILKNRADKFQHIKFPLIDDDGNYLWDKGVPADIDEIQQDKVMFSSIWQQDPIVNETQIFNIDVFNRYDKLPDESGFYLQSWDTAYGRDTNNDFSVCTTWFCSHGNMYLVDIWREKMEFNRLLEVIISQVERFDTDKLVIERKASGISILQVLIDKLKELNLGNILAVGKGGKYGILPDKDKIARASSASVSVAKKIYLPSKGSNIIPSEKMRQFEVELTNFPFGAHDDQVDSLTQAINYYTRAKMPSITRL